MVTPNLIGQTVRYQPKFSLSGGLHLVVAIVLLVCNAVTHNQHFLMLSLPAILLGLFLYIYSDKAFKATLDSHAINVTTPPQQIPYNSIVALTLGGRVYDVGSPHMKPGRIEVVHVDGLLKIPPPDNIPAEELYRHLLSHRGKTPAYELNIKLRDYVQQQVAKFGSDRVWSFTARFNLKHNKPNRRVNFYSRIGVLIGCSWIIAPLFFIFGGGSEAIMLWVPIGFLTAILSGLVLLVSAIYSRGSAPKFPKGQASSIVVSPQGIAMIQGTLQGHLRWDELRDIRHGQKPIKSIPKTPLILVLEGASIRINDIYDQSLPHIAAVLQALWKQAPASSH